MTIERAEYRGFGPFAVSDAFDDSCWSRRRTARVFGLTLPWPFPIAYGLSGSSAVVMGVPVYGEKTPRYVKGLHRLFRRISDGKYWLMYRLVPKHQYHIVRTGLEPGYYDEDTLILHACMAMLCRYVEWHEGPDALAKFSADLRDNPDPNAPEGLQGGQADRQDEAVAIYCWWKIEKPADEKRRDELMHKLYGNRKLKTKPTDHPLLEEIVFEEFTGHEASMRETLRALEQKIEDDEQKMLHRLIDIRRSLWT